MCEIIFATALLLEEYWKAVPPTVCLQLAHAILKWQSELVDSVRTEKNTNKIYFIFESQEPGDFSHFLFGHLVKNLQIVFGLLKKLSMGEYCTPLKNKNNLFVQVFYAVLFLEECCRGVVLRSNTVVVFCMEV